MKLKQIRQELEQVMTEYGPDGDQSLEYYGLVIQDGECRSAKLYRRASRKSDEAELIAKYQNQSFFQAVIQYAKIYDFSLRRDEAGMTYMRLVFLPFKDVLRSEERFAQLLDLCHLNCDSAYFKQLTAYYHEMEFTGLSPLLKMGVELSESGEVLEAKAYFALKSYDDIYDNLGKRHLYDSCRHLVDKSLSLLQMGDLSDSFAEIAERLERIQYYPIFTGVNFADGYVEIKVYYETCFSSYDSATILHQENALAAMMLPEAAEMEEMHQGILKRGALLDGVSYSVVRDTRGVKKDRILWKPYYLLMDETLVQSRMLECWGLEKPGLENTDFEPYKTVLLVDEQDRPRGFMEKQAAHVAGERHRAFSVFLHDGDGNMLVQRRAKTKYHSPSLLTNACCSHPLTDRVVDEAGVRLKEELGISSIPLTELFVFPYCTEVGGGLVENEIDHVLAGVYAGTPELNLEEADEQRYVPFDELLEDVQIHPDQYTTWFRQLIGPVIHMLNEMKKS